jgi:glutamate-ammonia-ligase adenylyltransferase
VADRRGHRSLFLAADRVAPQVVGVQFLVLAHSHRHSDLVRNLGNIALLQMAGRLGLINAALAVEVADAYRTFRSIQHRLRLNGAERARVPPGEVEREADAVVRLWHAVFEDA